MMVVVLGAALATPSPEVASLEAAAGANAVENGAGDQLVEAILVGRWRTGLEAAAVAGHAKFLDHQRFVQHPRNCDLARKIVARVRLNGWPCAGQILRIRPVPVLRPDVRVDIIDRWGVVRVADALVGV